jgi:hypothetical protein
MRHLALTITGLCLAATASATVDQTTPLTIRTSKRVIVYGQQVQITGVVQDRPVGTAVIISLRRQGERNFLPVSNSTTDADGSFSFVFEPTVRSELQARSEQGVSPILTVRVKPRLTLTRRGGVLFARAVAAASLRGRHVWFQRRSSTGRWRSIRKVVLDDPPRRFRVKLPKGVSRVRVSLSRRQAGRGYEPTVSRVLVLRRR